MAFNSYALYYDLIYQRKAYTKECDFLKALFKRHGLKNPKTILDLGCGTGNHLIALAKRGYTVTGVDQSPVMLHQAKLKLEKFKLKAQLMEDSISLFKVKEKFDAAICMFSVINYIVNEKDIERGLKNIYRHMKRDSLFIFDFWNAPAVEKYYSPFRKKIYKTTNHWLERRSVTKVYPAQQLCTVDYNCTFKQSGHKVKNFKERHQLRYFSIEQLKRWLESAGFKLLAMYPFLNTRGQIRNNTWDITAVVRKVS